MNPSEAPAPAPGGGRRSGRPRPNPRRVEVVKVEQLSPRMKRVTFGGADLATFAWSGPAAHLKIIFPEPGSGVDVVPIPDPEGPRPKTTRTYTPRRWDAEKQQLEVDFAIHGEGPASEWAKQARVGQQLVMMGPARGYEADTQAPWYVIMADDSALPAAESIIEALPASTKVTVFAEVAAPDEERPLAGNGNVDVRWITRGDDATKAGTALERAIADFRWPEGPGRVYIGCESGAMRRLRGVVLDATGIDKARIVARGYWRISEVNHTDHDYAED